MQLFFIFFAYFIIILDFMHTFMHMHVFYASF